MSAARTTIPRTLVVTNDFPPRVGGVQQYVWNVVANLPAKRIAVLAPNWPGWKEHDAAAKFPVHRWPAGFLWPTADLQARPGQLRRQCLDRFRNAVGFFDRSDTNINLGGRLGRNDV